MSEHMNKQGEVKETSGSGTEHAYLPAGHSAIHILPVLHAGECTRVYT